MILTGNQGPTAVVTSTTILVPQTITETRPANLIPAGEVWEFDPDVSTTLTLVGNLVVEGTLRMRPSSPDVQHVIRFVGVDESRFVGGGMDVLDTDVGLWVMGGGALDLAGHPRERWNRTGTSPTWLPDDELVIAPNVPGDYEFRPFTAGDPVPTVTAPDGTVIPTEVFNLTSNVRIEGTEQGRSHVFIRSEVPQNISNLGLRWMGPRVATKDGVDPVLGRYPLHFHHAEDGSRGSLIEGVVVRDSTRAFVPHGSHGITFRGCVAYGILDDAYWWDLGHDSNDTLWEDCAAFDVARQPAYRGTTTGFFLGNGEGNVIRGCVAGVIAGFDSCSGFHWPEMAGLGEHSVWTAEDLTVHNSRGSGVNVWQNDGQPHTIRRLVAYSNGAAGQRHGAYGNVYANHDGLLFGNAKGDLRHMAIPLLERAGPQVWDNMLIEQLVIGEHIKGRRPENTYPVVFDNLRCRRVRVNEEPPPPRPFGWGTYVLNTAEGWPLTPDDVEVVSRWSTITVRNFDGTGFDL